MSGNQSQMSDDWNAFTCHCLDDLWAGSTVDGTRSNFQCLKRNSNGSFCARHSMHPNASCSTIFPVPVRRSLLDFERKALLAAGVRTQFRYVPICVTVSNIRVMSPSIDFLTDGFQIRDGNPKLRPTVVSQFNYNRKNKNVYLQAKKNTGRSRTPAWIGKSITHLLVRNLAGCFCDSNSDPDVHRGSFLRRAFETNDR